MKGALGRAMGLLHECQRVAFILMWGALIVAPLAACNDVGDCPAPSTITPGGSCGGDNLECPYTLETPSPVCDGTHVEGGLATSCVCQKGSWSCPSPASCDASGGGDANDDSTAGEPGNDSAIRDASDGSTAGDAAATRDASDSSAIGEAGEASTTQDASNGSTLRDAGDGSPIADGSGDAPED